MARAYLTINLKRKKIKGSIPFNNITVNFKQGIEEVLSAISKEYYHPNFLKNLDLSNNKTDTIYISGEMRDVIELATVLAINSKSISKEKIKDILGV